MRQILLTTQAVVMLGLVLHRIYIITQQDRLRAEVEVKKLKNAEIHAKIAAKQLELKEKREQ